VRASFAICSCVLAIGCVSSHGYSGPDLLSTSETAIRHQYRGFSVAPPRQPGWKVRVSEQTSGHAIFRKEHTQTHSYLVGVNLYAKDKDESVEEAAERIRSSGMGDGSRLKQLSYDQRADTSWGKRCVAFRHEIVDTAAPNAPGTPLRLVERGFLCLHPTEPNTVLMAFCSERGLEAEITEISKQECDLFLRGIQMESAPGKPVT